jgi:AcrR family transcriptional regulator
VVSSPASQDGSPTLARREQIVEAARAVIEEHGPQALTGQIAQRAGLARPNVYRHFASKDELDLEVTRSAYQELHAKVVAQLDLSGTPIEVIRRPIAAQVIWADQHPNLFRFLASRGDQPTHRGRQSQRRDFAADLVAAGTRHFPHFADDRHSADAVIVALAGLVDASILAWLNRRKETRKRLIDRLTRQTWLLIDDHLREIGVHIDPDAPLGQTAPRAAKKTLPKRRSTRRPATASTSKQRAR